MTNFPEFPPDTGIMAAQRATDRFSRPGISRICNLILDDRIKRIYNKSMEIEFDLTKDAANIAKHGVSLARTADLDILQFVENTRAEDGERRFRLYGHLDGTAYCAVVTLRDGITRAISLRRANRTERNRHGL